MSANSLPVVLAEPANPHLGFGEYDDNLVSQTTIQKAHSVGTHILTAAVIVLILGLVGTIVAAPVAIVVASALILAYGVAVGGGTGFLAIAGFAIFAVKNLYSANSLPAKSKIIDAQAPTLGLYSKNTILPTEHGEESWKWKMELLKITQESCEVSGNFVGGEYFRNFLVEAEKVLTERPHVKIHMIGSSELIEQEDRGVLAHMRKKFPRNFHFLETGLKLEFLPSLRSIENHVKLFVVDGKYFMIGGTGLQKELGATKGEKAPPVVSRPIWKKLTLAPENRDMDFVGEGPTAKTCRVEFFKLWELWSKKMSHVDSHSGYFLLSDKEPQFAFAAWEQAKKEGKAVSGVDVKLLVSDAEKPNAILVEHQKSIKKAQKEIKCGNLIFSDQSIVDCFNVAAQKQVKIDIITIGLDKESPDNQILFASQNYGSYLPLLMGRKIQKIDTCPTLEAESRMNKVAVAVYEFAVNRVLYHKKVLVVDGKKIVAGSYNYGDKSRGVEGRGGDCEISLSMKSEALALRVSELLDKDIALSRPVTLPKAFEHYHNFIAWVQKRLLSRFFV